MIRADKPSDLQLLSFLVPFALAVAIWYSAVFGVLSVLTLILLILLLPVCRKRENLWMFVMASITLLPINIRVGMVAAETAVKFLSETKFLYICALLLTISIVYCLEQLFLGIIIRLLRGRQYIIDIE